MEELPKPQHDEFLDIDGEWESLISSIEATDIPLEMLRLLRVHHNNGQRYIFPIKEWLDTATPLANVQAAVDNWYREHGEDIAGSDFIIDLDKLKNTVKAETNKALKNL